jgi:ABC-type glycerol-3-phosphate transport system permease component
MNIGTLKDDLKEYIHTQADIIKLKAIDKVQKVLANTILGITLALLSLFILLFFSFSAAYAISSSTGRPFLGFLIVGGFYLLLALVMVALRKKLLNAYHKHLS